MEIKDKEIPFKGDSMRKAKAIWTSLLLSVGLNSYAQSVCDEVNVRYEASIRLRLMVELHDKGIDISKENLDALMKIDTYRLEDILIRTNGEEIDSGTNGKGF